MRKLVRHILLDRGGDAPVKEGYRVITSEIDFLRLAPEEPRLLVRGKSLCNWAETYFSALNIHCETISSPSQELMDVLPELSPEDARALVNRLGNQIEQLSRPISINQVLQILFPGRLWTDRPSITHAANWLLWLITAPNDNDLRPLYHWRAKAWSIESQGPEYELYKACDAQTAQEILDQWLGIAESKQTAEWGVFPTDIPESILKRARDSWKRRIIDSEGDFFENLLEMQIPPKLLEIAAEITAEYYQHHPEGLSWEVCDRLRPYLSASLLEKLFDHVRPPEPTDPPEHAGDVLQWFQNHYLPYRLWQHNRDSANSRESIQKAARAFAIWYLNHYPEAIIGAPFSKELSFRKMAALREADPTSVVLVMVLDGLHLIDAQQLQSLISNEIPRLTILKSELAFAPLPTITEFCKPALFSGEIPIFSGDTAIGKVLPENQTPLDALCNAENGQVFLWRIMEPDHTYHEKNSYATLQAEVQSQLVGIVNKINQLVNEIPAHIQLQIIVTTDHGRLLQTAERMIPVPDNFQAQGRAAWGDSGKSYPSCGYLIEDELVYLYRESFGLPYDVVVPLDDRVFLTKDGKKGKENFPHGGLYPEEVIVPWIAMARDYEEPEISVVVTGEGETNREGVLEVSITNFSSVDLRISGMLLNLGRQGQTSIDVELLVEAYSFKSHRMSYSPWPNAKDAEHANGRVIIRQPNGLTFEKSVTLELHSKEMYSHQDLEDLFEGMDL